MEEAPVRLRIHVSEPFDFERQNPSPDMLGTSFDPLDEDADEWLISMDLPFTFHEDSYREMLVAPRYVGEHLSRVFDSIVGLPVRIAHRTDEGWHYAMTGLLSVPHEDRSPREGGPEDPGSVPGSKEDLK